MISFKEIEVNNFIENFVQKYYLDQVMENEHQLEVMESSEKFYKVFR